MATYLLLLNQTTTPIAGQAAVAAFPFDPAGTAAPSVRQLSRADFGELGRKFSVGIAWAVSTTPDVVTFPTPGDVLAVVNALST